MNIVKIDQVSVAAKAGALDGSLALAERYDQNREIIAETALSGLRGMLEVLSETGIYGSAIRSLEEAAERLQAANDQAAKDPFTAGSPTQDATAKNAVNSGRRSTSNGLNPAINAARSAATAATNGTAVGTAERTAGLSVQAAADAIAAANTAFRDGDPSSIESAHNLANSARTEAQAAYDNAPTDRKASALAVLNAAIQTLATATSLVDLRDTPIAKLAGVTPSTTDLGSGYALSTWGNTGYVTITDAAGKGVIISPNGSVDPLDGAGKGWKFSNTSTFVLPGDTKITVNPGSPSNLLVSRGIHAFTVENLQNGQPPATSDYTTLDGRAVDRASNDGHIFMLDGDAAHWTLSGSPLGDASSREVVATSPVVNELKLDPTDVPISAGLRAFIDEHLGNVGLDYDGDGKLNNTELSLVANNLASVIKSLQDNYEEALAKLTKANDAIADLNVLLELIRKEDFKGMEERGNEEASSKAELQAVERRLVDALYVLRSGGPQTPLPGGVGGGAEDVLKQLTSVTQQGGVQKTGPASASPGPETNKAVGTTNSPSIPIETLGQPVNTGADPLGDSMRRAGRLLSGPLRGGALNFAEIPSTRNTPSTDAVGGAGNAPLPNSGFSSLDALASAFFTLLTRLSALNPAFSGAAGTNASQENLSAGLQGSLTALSDLGLLDSSALRNSTSLQEFLQTLSQSMGAPSSEVGVGDGPAAAASLLSFLGTLAQFGSALKAVAPQATQTTPGQVEKAGTASFGPLSATSRQALEVLSGQAKLGSAGASQGSGSTTNATGELAQLSRTAEQLRLVLAGIATLGSAGATQSTGNDESRIPASAELRLGLQSLLGALAAFGIFATNNQSDQASTNSGSDVRASATNTPPAAQPATAGFGFQNGNTQAIETISGNFQTDPQLMKIIQENLSKALQTQQKQLSRASTLFEQSQQIVEEFVGIIQQDDLVREVVKSDDLSDEQQALFDDRMKDLRKDLGVEWGGPEDHGSAAAKSSLISRAVQSGMMV